MLPAADPPEACDRGVEPELGRRQGRQQQPRRRGARARDRADRAEARRRPRAAGARRGRPPEPTRSRRRAATAPRRSSRRSPPSTTCRSPASRPAPATTSRSISGSTATTSSAPSTRSSTGASAASTWPRSTAACSSTTCRSGIYAEAVQREGYRDAKLRTILDTVPDVLGSRPSEVDERPGLARRGRHRPRVGGGDPRIEQPLPLRPRRRLGHPAAHGRRRAGDRGAEGAAAGLVVAGTGRRWHQWSAPAFEVTSSQPVPVGVDGEALVLDPPLRFVSRPGALRVRIAPAHPGASPSATLPEQLHHVLARLLSIAAGRA